MGLFGLSLGDLTSGVGIAQGAFNLYKDIFNVDMQRQTDANEYLMGVQHGYNKESMQLQNDYNLGMMEAQNNYNVQNMMRQFGYSSDLQKQAFEQNKEMQENQFAMNALLNDQGRAIAQSRGAGINPASSASAGGSVSAPGSSAPSSGLPSSAAPSASALGSSFGAPSVSHYLSDILSSVEAGLKLDTYREEIRKRKAATKKAEQEARITETEANNRQRWLDTLMANGTTQAEAQMLATQIDAGYKRAMIDINNRLADIKDRGVKVDEAKVDAVVKDILADAAWKQQQEKLTRKDIHNYEERLAKSLKIMDEQGDLLHENVELARKGVSWYEVNQMLGTILQTVQTFKPSTVVNKTYNQPFNQVSK